MGPQVTHVFWAICKGYVTPFKTYLLGAHLVAILRAIVTFLGMVRLELGCPARVLRITGLFDPYISGLFFVP